MAIDVPKYLRQSVSRLRATADEIATAVAAGLRKLNTLDKCHVVPTSCNVPLHLLVTSGGCLFLASPPASFAKLICTQK